MKEQKEYPCNVFPVTKMKFNKINTPFLRRKTLLSVDKIEQEAIRFAVELLIQDEDLESLKDMNLTLCDVAAIFGVPKEVCHLKKI